MSGNSKLHVCKHKILLLFQQIVGKSEKRNDEKDLQLLQAVMRVPLWDLVFLKISCFPFKIRHHFGPSFYTISIKNELILF